MWKSRVRQWYCQIVIVVEHYSQPPYCWSAICRTSWAFFSLHKRNEIIIVGDVATSDAIVGYVRWLSPVEMTDNAKTMFLANFASLKIEEALDDPLGNNNKEDVCETAEEALTTDSEEYLSEPLR